MLAMLLVEVRLLIKMGEKVIFVLDKERKDFHWKVSAMAGLTASELFRRMLDYCHQDHILDQLVPCMSGQLTIGINQ